MKKNYFLILFLIISTTASAQLVLSEVLFDPPGFIAGDANRDGTRQTFGDEFIELVNTGGSDLNISGYKIYDKEEFDKLPGTDTPRHLVPPGTIIPAGGIYVVFGGSVNDLDSDLTTIRTAFPTVTFQLASSGFLDLQDAGDDVYVNDASGTNVITFKPADYSLNMGANQSATRRGSISDPVFTRHRAINRTSFSPGELFYFTNTFPLVLNEVIHTPGVDINGDGNVDVYEDEFIEFVNNSGASVDISGYKILDNGPGIDAANPRHLVPANTVIPDGGVYLLFGGGTPTGTFGNSTVQVASTGELNLTDNSDIIYVFDASDNMVFTLDSAETGIDTSIANSATRSPDITGGFVAHPAAEAGVNYSPGTKTDGTSLSTVNKFTATTGNWSTSGNWSLGNVPLLTDVVEIPFGNTADIDVDNTAAKDVVIGGALNINAGKSLTINRDLYNVGSFNIASAGSLIVEGSSTGNVVYNRALNFESGNTKGWHLITSPVIGQVFNDAYATTNNLSTNGANRGLGIYATNDDTWTYLQDNDSNAGTFDTGKGYAAKIAVSGDISFEGTINTTSTNVVLAITGNRFNLLGNPYTSYINSATFLTNEAVISDNKVIWVWDQTLSVDGAYVPKIITDNFVVAPGQGFFVQSNVAGGTFTFSEANQVNNNTDTFLKSSDKALTLSITDGNINNYAKLYYLNNATTGFDSGYDGELFSGVANPFAVYTHLASDNQGKNYQVQSLPENSYDSSVVQVGLNAAAGKEISFSVETSNLPAATKVYLEDRDTNTFTLLSKSNATYKVTLANTAADVGRFYLHISQKALSVDYNNYALENVSMYKTSNNTLKVLGLQEGEASIEMFTILGKQVLKQSFTTNGAKEVALPLLAKGVYLVTVQTGTAKTSRKIIIE